MGTLRTNHEKIPKHPSLQSHGTLLQPKNSRQGLQRDEKNNSPNSTQPRPTQRTERQTYPKRPQLLHNYETEQPRIPGIPKNNRTRSRRMEIPHHQNPESRRGGVIQQWICGTPLNVGSLGGWVRDNASFKGKQSSCKTCKNAYQKCFLLRQ